MEDLSIKNLHMHFSGVRALDGVSFTVKEGEIFSLIGANGSGKSTLFNCINRYCVPQEGLINYRGKNILDLPSHHIVQLGIARTFQNLQNVPYMTLLDNVLLGAHKRLSTNDTIKRWLYREEREREESMALELCHF
tara:strand:+ start:1349 stop:1756 length:408 start_codon:yes stop_codon:yes gene_type:complete